MCAQNCSCVTKCADCTCEKPPAPIMVLCSQCGEDVDTRMTIDVQGSPYCPTCAEDQSCTSCGEKIPFAAVRWLDDGDPICPDCSGVCERCQELDLADNMSPVNMAHLPSQQWCESCVDNLAFCCNWCDETYHYSQCTDIHGDSYCQRCVYRHFHYCDGCDEWHGEDDDCEYGCFRQKENSYDAEIGSPTSRFTIRTVGIEIETGTGATKPAFADALYSKFPNWGNKDDSSLSCGGRELVSPPMGGDRIEQVTGVYDLLHRHHVDMEDEDAGCHIHVDFRDCKELLHEEYDREMTRKVPIDYRRNTFLFWGNQAVRAARRLVEPGRAANHYCASPFGFRESYERSDALRNKLAETGYASVAVRQDTLEFRIWSVTGNADLSLARLEFSQKSVEYLRRMLATTPHSQRAYCKRLERAVGLLVTGNFTPLARLFRLTKPTIDKLKPFARAAATHHGTLDLALAG